MKLTLTLVALVALLASKAQGERLGSSSHEQDRDLQEDTPPLATLERASTRPAQGPLPRVNIEVGRVGAVGGRQPQLRREKGQFIVEQPFTLETEELPNVPQEEVDVENLPSQTLKQRGPGGDLDGFAPRHLPVQAVPDKEKLDVERDRGSGPTDEADAVFPPDTRYVFKDTKYPWSTVGRVETACGTCTGTMVGERLMLTAQHCICRTSGGAARWMRFKPAYYSGATPFGTAYASRFLYYNRISGPGLTDYESANDSVVVVLNSRIGKLTGFAGFRTYNTGWNGKSYWQHVGYPGPLTSAERPVFFGGASIVRTRTFTSPTVYTMGHCADTQKGHSGGPFWGWWSGDPFPRIIGDQSASPSTPKFCTSTGDNEAAGGPGLSSLIAYGRDKYA